MPTFALYSLVLVFPPPVSRFPIICFAVIIRVTDNSVRGPTLLWLRNAPAMMNGFVVLILLWLLISIRCSVIFGTLLFPIFQLQTSERHFTADNSDQFHNSSIIDAIENTLLYLCTFLQNFWTWEDPSEAFSGFLMKVDNNQLMEK